ncbi:hypothetical protein AHAS_Ahas09G0156700 [Arachis hypogaea]
MQMARSSVKNRKKRNAAKKIGEKGTVSVEYKCLLNLLPRDIWVRIATKVASYSIKDLFNMQVTCLFLECCAAAGNPVALLRVGMTEFVWIGHCIGGIDTQTMATIGGDLEACYMCTMLLPSHGKCREVFKQVFAGRWMEVKPLDPGQPEVCRSTSCRTQGTMSDVEDLSRVSCVQCLADYEGLTKYFWIVRRSIGMELLAKASTECSDEAGYLFAMLLLCDHEDEEEVQSGVEC